MSTLLTDDELYTIRRSLFLAFLMDVIANQMRKIEPINGSLKELYIKSTEALLQKVHADLVKDKAAMKAAGIKVVERDRTSATLEYEVFYRGRNEKLGFIREVVKAELGVMLTKYIAELSQELSKRPESIR